MVRIYLDSDIDVLGGAGFSPDEVCHAANEHVRDPLFLQDRHHRMQSVFKLAHGDQGDNVADGGGSGASDGSAHHQG